MILPTVYGVFWILVIASSLIVGENFQLFPSLLTSLANNENCRNHSLIFQKNLRDATTWAVRVWDASVKEPTGWLFGNEAQFGNFDECLTTKAPFPLQFCLVHFNVVPSSGQSNISTVWHEIQVTSADKISIPRSSVWMGICAPSSCSQFISEKQNNLTISQRDGSVNNAFCTTADAQITITWGQILFWVVSALLVVTIILATFLDVQSNCNEWKIVNWLSLRQNWSILIAPSLNSDHPLSILHGLRVAAVVVVVYAHRLGIPVSFSAFNHGTWEDNLRNVFFRFSAQADMTVDTFFFISGILMSYSNRSNNSVYSIASRIFRLSPLYLWVIWLVASAIPVLGSGPLWNAVQVHESELCARNWWLNALFLQNYVKDSEMCLTHTWYIPCEFHFFLLALLLKPLVEWHRPIGLGVTRFLTGLAVVMPGLVTFRLKLDPMVLFYLPEFLANPRGSLTFLEAYTKSHNRAAAYLIGFLSGFYLASSEHRLGQQNWKRSLGWFVASLALLFIPMAYGVRYYDPTSLRLDWEVALFATFRRPIWALGLLCLILAHRTHPLPVVGRVLSCRAAVVLSRLAYGVYLLHFPIIMANMAKLRAPPVFNWFDVVFSGDLASCLIFSAIMYLFIEMPVKRMLTGLIFPVKINAQKSLDISTATTPV